jgi:RNA polymerase sigma factor (sigma-70 family)
MIGDEDLDTILTALSGQLDDAELSHRTAGFRDALHRLRHDPAETARIDALASDADDGQPGDRAAWEEIVERYAPLVWSICVRYRLDRQDIDDVSLTVWLRLMENFCCIREPAALPGWLATTTHRECLRVLRSARRQEQSGLPPVGNLPSEPAAMTIEQEILIAEREASIRAAFAELPPGCRELLSMLVSDTPHSYAEISATLGIPVGSIGPRRARCLQRLRQSITPSGASREPGT